MLDGEPQDTREYASAIAALGENPSEKDITLYAIATFVRQNTKKLPKNRIARFLAINSSYFVTTLKSLPRYTNRLDDFGKTFDNCIDMAVVIKILTSLYGIEGDIRLPGKGGPTPFIHHYWQEKGEEGSLIDVNFCPRVNGFVQDSRRYAEEVKTSKKWRKSWMKEKRGARNKSTSDENISPPTQPNSSDPDQRMPLAA